MARSSLYRARALTLAALPTLTSLTSCISYRTTPAASPGTTVRVTFAPQSADELTRYFGPRAASVEGHVVGATDSTLTVAVSSVTRVNGVEETWPGDRIALPRSTVAQLQTRRLDRARTIGLSAAIAAAAVLLARAFQSSEDVSRGPGRGSGGSTQ